VLKFRWRGAGDQIQTQTFPRVSRRQFQTLKEVKHGEAQRIIRERVAGHLDALILDPARRGKARLAAQRLGISGSEAVSLAREAGMDVSRWR
jgi:hypothetical protein